MTFRAVKKHANQKVLIILEGFSVLSKLPTFKKKYFIYLYLFSLVGCRLWGRTELDTTEAT